MIYKISTTNSGCEFKDADSKQGIVSGYFSNFNNVDNDGDIMMSGCYSKSIKENFARIKHLQNHRVDSPLGKLITLNEDAKGLAYTSQIGTHSLGLDFIKMVESGLITEHSVGFQTVKRTQIGEYGDPNGTWQINEVKLWEGSSLTGWGANQLTPLTGLKGISVENVQDRIKRIEKFCKHTTATDECIENLLLEIKQLGQIILDLKNTQAAAPLEPDSNRKFLNELNNLLTLKK